MTDLPGDDTPPRKALLTIGEAEIYLGGISNRKLRQLVYDGILRYTKVGARRFLRVDELDAYIDRCTQSAAS